MRGGRSGDRATTTPTALVLAGGGAFAAYEAGVLLYLLDELPRETGLEPRFDIFAGTSAGAINVSVLAAWADDLAGAARRLADFWRRISLREVVRFGYREARTLGRLLLGPIRDLAPRPSPPRARSGPHEPVAGLFDSAPLRGQLEELIPWGRLQQHLASGLVRAVALCATEVCTGVSVIFYETAAGVEYKEGRDPNKEVQRVRVGVDHAMASSAIPFLFPAVLIDGVCYTDGALRQNTPLNPALRLGAQRVLVVSLTQQPGEAKRTARIGCRRSAYPGALFLLGRTVPILMSQSLDYELQRVDRYNRLIQGGCAEYGDRFLATVNDVLTPSRNADYRRVSTCHLRPSQSLTELARQTARQALPGLQLPGLPGSLVARVLASAALADTDLSGYLMFAPAFTSALVDLGFRDARAAREQLLGLFTAGDEGAPDGGPRR
jgi:NTE family protein